MAPLPPPPHPYLDTAHYRASIPGFLLRLHARSSRTLQGIWRAKASLDCESCPVVKTSPHDRGRQS